MLPPSGDWTEYSDLLGSSFIFIALSGAYSSLVANAVRTLSSSIDRAYDSLELGGVAERARDDLESVLSHLEARWQSAEPLVNRRLRRAQYINLAGFIPPLILLYAAPSLSAPNTIQFHTLLLLILTWGPACYLAVRIDLNKLGFAA